MDRELTDREALFAVLASAPDGIMLVTGAGTVALANEAAERLFGYEHGELRGLGIEQLVPPRLRDDHVGARRAYAARPRRRPMGSGLDLVGLRKDGTEFPAEISLSPMRWAGEELVIAIVRDVSERKAAETERIALARAHAVEQVVAGLDAIVWESGHDHDRFVYVGGRDDVLLGYPRERWLEPGFWRSIVHADDRSFLLAYRNAARERQTFEVEYRVVDAHGRVVFVHDTVSAGDDGRLRGVLVDVGGRRELEARLTQALKMEAIGHLAGGIAHDFNNLVTIAAGHARRLARRTADPDDRRELDQIVAAADRAATLTRKLLTFARRSETTLERLELAAVVDGVMPMLESALPPEIDVGVALAPGSFPVRADRAQVEQVVMNLVLNARDAMPEGGALGVRVEPLTLDADDAARRGVGPGRYALLVVSDSGHGIPPEIRDRIFEPFFSTKEAERGTGLGLATVYGIVEAAGGFIEVDSDPGRGTTFRLGLPLADEVALAGPRAAAGAGPVVLVVDDERGLRELAHVVLADAGYSVLEAGNGREALAIAEHFRDRIELLLTDVVMPQLSGPELALQLRRLRPDLRVLYMSGYHDSDLARRGLDAAAAVIQKPFDPDELAAMVGRIVGRAR